MQEQKRRLERLAEGKAAAERKREEKSREEQQSVLTLRQSLHQLSEREREVRAREREAVALAKPDGSKMCICIFWQKMQMFLQTLREPNRPERKEYMANVLAAGPQMCCRVI